MSMDLKGLIPSDLISRNARVRVWYEEDGVKTSYVGTVTTYAPAQGMSVWFDGMTRLEQEWVDGDDEWAWEEEPPVPGAESLKLSAVRLHMRGPTISEMMNMRLRGLPVDPAPPTTTLRVLSGSSVLSSGAHNPSPRSFGKKARLLAAAAELPSSPAAGASVAAESTSGGKRAAAALPGSFSSAPPPKVSRSGARKPAAPGASDGADAAAGAAPPTKSPSAPRVASRKPAAEVADAASVARSAVPSGALSAAAAGSGGSRRSKGAAAAAPAGTPGSLARYGSHAAGAVPPALHAGDGTAGTAEAAALAALAAARAKRRAGPSTSPRLLVRADGVRLLVPAAKNDETDETLRALGFWGKAGSYPPDAAAKYGLCALSGLPARYRDPLTGVRYGNLDAFKRLRAEHGELQAGGAGVAGVAGGAGGAGGAGDVGGAEGAPPGGVPEAAAGASSSSASASSAAAASAAAAAAAAEAEAEAEAAAAKGWVPEEGALSEDGESLDVRLMEVEG
jgi:hypothetical protein